MVLFQQNLCHVYQTQERPWLVVKLVRWRLRGQAEPNTTIVHARKIKTPPETCWTSSGSASGCGGGGAGVCTTPPANAPCKFARHTELTH